VPLIEERNGDAFAEERGEEEGACERKGGEGPEGAVVSPGASDEESGGKAL
jgi:hypothetical protein